MVERLDSLVVPEPTYTAAALPDGKREVRFGQFGRWLLNNHLDTIRARRAYDRQSQEHPVFKGAEALAVTALESIPWIGDGATVLEAIRGKTFDGMPLSAIERGLYLLFSIPTPPSPIDLPARPAIAVYHQLDEHIFTPLLLATLGPEAQREEQQARAASYTPRRDVPFLSISPTVELA